MLRQVITYLKSSPSPCYQKPPYLNTPRTSLNRGATNGIYSYHFFISISYLTVSKVIQMTNFASLSINIVILKLWTYRKLSLYPNGDKFRDGRDHISIYLALAEMSSLPSGWEINVVFNFFILNQLQNKYFIIQGRTYIINSNVNFNVYEIIFFLKEFLK